MMPRPPYLVLDRKLRLFCAWPWPFKLRVMVYRTSLQGPGRIAVCAPDGLSHNWMAFWRGVCLEATWFPMGYSRAMEAQ